MHVISAAYGDERELSVDSRHWNLHLEALPPWGKRGLSRWVHCVSKRYIITVGVVVRCLVSGLSTGKAFRSSHPDIVRRKEHDPVCENVRPKIH